jgi:hypothetical protein
MNFESGGKYFLAQCLGSFFIGQSFQEEFDRLSDVRKSFSTVFPCDDNPSVLGTRRSIPIHPVQSPH